MVIKDREVLIQRWQRQLNGRTHVQYQELMHLLRQRLLLNALFCLFDRDTSGLISEAEWIGSVYKVAEISGRAHDVRSLEPFIRAFKRGAHQDGSLSLEDFCILFEDLTFRREFTLLFLDDKKPLTVMEFTDVLRSVSEIKSDTKWLSWLAYQFHIAVSSRPGPINESAQDSMDLETFKKSFHFKIPEMADCLFDYLDTDKTGRLTLEKFIRNLEFVIDASDAEKVEFLFKIFDRDGDGAIDFEEMKLLFRCFLEQTPSLDIEETIAELTATLFQETDIDQSGDISLEELTSAFQRNEHLFKVLSLSASSWIRPKPTSVTKYHKGSSTLRSWMRNNIDLIFFWTLYSFICMAICIDVIHTYVGIKRAHIFIVIARLNGGMLNFNCALMLVLMLRKHITWLRTRGGSVLLPLDHHIDIHKTIGIIIMIETFLHTIAHLAYLGYVFYVCALPQDSGTLCVQTSASHMNSANNISITHMSDTHNRYRFDSNMDMCVPFPHLGCGGNSNNFPNEALCIARCKPYKDTSHQYAQALFTAKLGLGYITGVLELLLGALIYVMCLPFVRKTGHFQLFYWCHMLTLPWLVIMLLHAPRFWKWLIIPGSLYIIEKILRYKKSRSNKHGETYIMEAILLPSQVIHLVINKPRKFTYKPGDYIYINIPAVANFEWHPFSISSAPEHKDCLWLHLRVNGHWTRRVYELFRTKLKQKHAIAVNDGYDLRLRSSMRSRMSRSYIDELRGVSQQDRYSQFDMNNNDDSNRSSHCSMKGNSTNSFKPFSISLPPAKPQQKLTCSSCHSIVSLKDIQLKSNIENPNAFDEKHLTSSQKLSTIDRKDFEVINVEDLENFDDEKDDVVHRLPPSKPVRVSRPPKTNTNRLTVPTVGDFCIRIPEQQSYSSDPRLSDALGYLRMYKDQNRIHFNNLQYEERDDLQVLIDGPYGAPSQDIFEAEHAVLIAAGIGITPFASILQSIMCRYRNRRHKCPNCEHIWDNPETEELCVKKVDFIWVTREQRSLEWFISLLAQMEIEQQRLKQNPDENSLLDVHLYVTSAKSPSDLKALNVYLSLDLIGRENSIYTDAIDGIRSRTNHGRPDWDQVFTELLCQKKGKISVFYCGPPALSAELTTKCRQYGFAYKKELF